MAKETPSRSVLIVDPDEEFLASLQLDPRANQYPAVVAVSGKEAQLLLSDQRNRFMGVFINPSITDLSWVSVVKCCYSLRPATPIYLLLDGEMTQELTHLDLKRLGIRQAVTKPFYYRELLDIVSPIALSFDAEEALEKARKNKDQVGGKITGSDAEFIPIRSEDFLAGTQSFFDLYIRLNATKYIKLLQAGDSFPIDRLEGYLKKGVMYFYLRKQVQEEYLKYCDHIASAILKHKDVPMEFKTAQILNQGEETMKFLNDGGVDPSNIRYAMKFVGNVRELVEQMKVGNGHFFAGFMANVAAYEHGVATTMLGSILANVLEIKMEKPVQIVGMATLMHDIGLSDAGGAFAEEDESIMSDADRELYHLHPRKGAEILLKAKVDAAAVQAVEQHHMRQGGKGFPERTRAVPISKVAEIVGICSEFNHLIKKSQTNKMSAFEVLAVCERDILPLFSKQMSFAFRMAFFPKTVQ